MLFDQTHMCSINDMFNLTRLQGSLKVMRWARVLAVSLYAYSRNMSSNVIEIQSAEYVLLRSLLWFRHNSLLRGIRDDFVT